MEITEFIRNWFGVPMLADHQRAWAYREEGDGLIDGCVPRPRGVLAWARWVRDGPSYRVR